MLEPPILFKYKIPLNPDFLTADLVRAYTDYSRMSKQLSENEVKKFFVNTHLLQMICACIQLNFNIDYKCPPNSSDLSVTQLLANIYNIISRFNIKISIDIARHEYRYISEWLKEAVEWIDDIIKPYLMLLKYNDELVNHGTQYLSLIIEHNKIIEQYYQTSDDGEKKSHHTQCLSIKEQITTLECKIRNKIICDIIIKKDYFKNNGYSYKLSQIKHHIMCSKSRLVSSNSQPAPQQQSSQNNSFYCTEVMPTIECESKCRFETLAYGLLYLAQKELCLPAAKRKVFNKIAAFLPHIEIEKLTQCIETLTFVPAFSDSAINYPSAQDSSSKSIVSAFINKLRKTLASNKLSKLTKDLKSKEGAIHIFLWTEIFQVFWYCYNGRPLPESPYFLHDKKILQNIKNSVNHIKKLEQSSPVEFIRKNKAISKLSSHGLWLTIAIVFDRFHASYHGELLADEHLLKDTNHLFSTISIFDFQDTFLRYFYSMQLSVNVQIKYGTRQLLDYIAACARHVNHKLPSLGKSIVITSYENESLSIEGIDILKAHLMDDSRFNLDPKETAEKKSPIAPHERSKLLSSKTQRLFRAPPSGKNEVEMNEMQSNYGTAVITEFEFDTNALALYQPNTMDIQDLCEDYFNITVIFHSHNDFLWNYEFNPNLPVLHLTMTNQIQDIMRLYIEPFNCQNNSIFYWIAAFSNKMTSAQLSKQEIINILNDAIPLKYRALPLQFFQNVDLHIKLAIMIVHKCRENSSSVSEALQLLVTSRDTVEKSTVLFKLRVDYLFYRYYGKSFEQTVEQELKIINSSESEIEPITLPIHHKAELS